MYQDSTGAWYFKVTVGRDPLTGRREQITRRGFRTATEAARARRDVLDKNDTGRIKPPPKLLTVDELLDLQPCHPDHAEGCRGKARRRSIRTDHRGRGGKLKRMARRRITVELDSELLDGVQAAAHRLGIPEDELFEQGLRQIIARDFNRVMDEVTVHQAKLGIALSDDVAMALANAELAALRTERRNA